LARSDIPLPRVIDHDSAVRTADVDALILRLAAAQHGIVARWQLVPAGVPATLLDERVKRRRLERVARCVYRVPGLDGRHADVVATVLAFGAHAVASHDTAGRLHDLCGHDIHRMVVSTWRGHPDRRADVVLHRVRPPCDERITCDGVTVTSIARTLLDLAAALPDRAFEQALARGLRLHDGTRAQLVALLARYPRRPGTPRLRAPLASDEPPAMTRSDAEERFLALVRTAQLPAPRVNTRIHGFEADFYWPNHAVVVEIDGLAYHTARAAQLRDRHRDSSLGAAGIRVLRFTWQDLTARPEATLVKVALALGRSAI
jgi:very-short-patch-repair endonuclease